MYPALLLTTPFDSLYVTAAQYSRRFTPNQFYLFWQRNPMLTQDGHEGNDYICAEQCVMARTAACPGDTTCHRQSMASSDSAKQKALGRAASGTLPSLHICTYCALNSNIRLRGVMQFRTLLWCVNIGGCMFMVGSNYYGPPE